MKVLIAKMNEGVIKELYPSAKFQESTEHTSTFTISPLRFKTLYQTVKVKGYNPYALMSW